MSFGGVNTPGGWLVEVKRKLSDLVTRMTSAERTISGLSGMSGTFVPNTRKINNKPLSSDVTLNAGDVGALTQTQADGRYLKTSGGTLEGALAVASAGEISFGDGATKLKTHGEYVFSEDGKIFSAYQRPLLGIEGLILCNELVITAAPTRGEFATNKKYVDDAVKRALPLTGGTLTGNLTIGPDGELRFKSARMGFEDVGFVVGYGYDFVVQEASTVTDAEGRTMAIPQMSIHSEGPILMVRGKFLGDNIVILKDRFEAENAVNKKYVDGRISGHTHTAAQMGAAPANHTHTAADVGALPITGGTLTGNLTIKGSGNYGTKINLGDNDYVHIAEPEDDCLEIKAKKINFVVSDTTSQKFTINGSPLDAGAAFVAQTTAPTDKTKLWICTDANSKGLKYWTGSAWAAVPVCWG